jgi:hypothetical protein
MMALAAASLKYSRFEYFQTFTLVNLLFWLSDLVGTFLLKRTYKPFEGAIENVRQESAFEYGWFVGHIVSPFFYIYGSVNAGVFLLLLAVDLILEQQGNSSDLWRVGAATFVLAATVLRHLAWRSAAYAWYRRERLKIPIQGAAVKRKRPARGPQADAWWRRLGLKPVMRLSIQRLSEIYYWRWIITEVSMMNCTRQAAVVFVGGLLLPVVGACFCSSITDQDLQKALKGFFSASDLEAKKVTLRAAEEIAQGVCVGSLSEMRTGSTERNRKMLHLLKALRYEISWGLTDAELETFVEKGMSGSQSKIESQIDGLFESNFVTRDLKVLDELNSNDALAFATFLCEARVVESGPLPVGASSTTWAAEDFTSVVYDLKLSRLAAHSERVKSFIETGALRLSRETCARFRWSGAKPICIKLPPVAQKRQQHQM